jgi:hypothetical protein
LRSRLTDGAALKVASPKKAAQLSSGRDSTEAAANLRLANDRYNVLGEIMADSLIVQSKLKDAVKGLDLRMDSNLADALNAKVAAILKDAANRAKQNGRGTLRPHDL